LGRAPGDHRQRLPPARRRAPPVLDGGGAGSGAAGLPGPPRARRSRVRFLFPIFLATAAAIAVPILLHMARRRTRREVAFGALMAFDRRPRTVLGVEAWTALAPDARVQAAADRLAALAPGWQATDLGRALVAAAEAIVDDEGDTPSALGRVILISDLQEGSRL